MPDIVLKDLTVLFSVSGGTVRAVDHVSFTFPGGKITGIIGESGCGKSVMGASILGMNPGYAKTSGQILYDGMDLLTLPGSRMRRLRGRRLGLIPQNPADSLNPARKILGQITESAALTGLNRADRKVRAESLLARFGFSAADVRRVGRSYPFMLSGGMQQRVAAAMGVASQPEWIIADEPSKGLDLDLRRQMYDMLRQIREEYTDSMLIITHDLALAAELCDSIAVMYSGQIIEAGPDVLKAPRHPYTIGLLESLPERGFRPMAGMAPSPREHFTGCKFAPRCPFVCSACTLQPPEFHTAGSGKVRCSRYA